MAFEPSQVEFLLTLGGQLAVAIDKSRLQEKVTQMAVLEERERIAWEMPVIDYLPRESCWQQNGDRAI
ncbi:MAG: hypothetical protein V3U31_06985 [Dehalococcoidia bacterium]